MVPDPDALPDPDAFPGLLVQSPDGEGQGPFPQSGWVHACQAGGMLTGEGLFRVLERARVPIRVRHVLGQVVPTVLQLRQR